MDTLNEGNVFDTISASHFEHTLWVNELRFFEDELKIYERQLERLVQKEDKSFLPMLERFQNNFIRQKEVLDELKHDIKVHEQRLGWAVKNNNYKEDVYNSNHEVMKEKMVIFKKLFTELKEEFFHFLVENHS